MTHSFVFSNRQLWRRVKRVANSQFQQFHCYAHGEEVTWFCSVKSKVEQKRQPCHCCNAQTEWKRKISTTNKWHENANISDQNYLYDANLQQEHEFKSSDGSHHYTSLQESLLPRTDAVAPAIDGMKHRYRQTSGSYSLHAVNTRTAMTVILTVFTFTCHITWLN